MTVHGLFSIAYATALAYGGHCLFDQSRMREHNVLSSLMTGIKFNKLNFIPVQSFIKKRMAPFPHSALIPPQSSPKQEMTLKYFIATAGCLNSSKDIYTVYR